MGLLNEIQASLLEGEKPLGPIVLKLRLLASRLGSHSLEEWVKHESEGYPEDVDVPDYRKLSVSYTGSFDGSVGSRLQNAPISLDMIEKHAGKDWTRFAVRQSVATIDDLLSESEDGEDALQVNPANLTSLLQGQIYKEYDCNGVQGAVARADMVGLRQVVRNRVLDLTIQLESEIPSALDVEIGAPGTIPDPKDVARVNQLAQNILQAPVTDISSSENDAQIKVSVAKGDKEALLKALTEGGFPEDDAMVLANIIATATPGTKDHPLSNRAKAWLSKSEEKIASGAWKISLDMATKQVSEVSQQFLGLSRG